MTEGPGRVPLAYMQVADDLAAKIRSGELAPGSRLPREADLAADYEVSYGTIRRAMEELRKRGLVITAWGKGNIVREQDLNRGSKND
jgi:DNA-binding GntR family transcriptional regulator